eukprot:7030342-Pyramimonas_sp.AAC.4
MSCSSATRDKSEAVRPEIASTAPWTHALHSTISAHSGQGSETAAWTDAIVLSLASQEPSFALAALRRLRPGRDNVKVLATALPSFSQESRAPFAVEVPMATPSSLSPSVARRATLHNDRISSPTPPENSRAFILSGVRPLHQLENSEAKLAASSCMAASLSATTSALNLACCAAVMPNFANFSFASRSQKHASADAFAKECFKLACCMNSGTRLASNAGAMFKKFSVSRR